MTLPIDSHATLSIRQTSTRMTPVPPSRRFGEVLAVSGRAVLEGALSAAAFVPGGNLITAAVRGVAGATPLSGTLGNGTLGGSSVPVDGATSLALGSSAGTGASGSSSSSSSLGGDDMLARQQQMSVQMLQLQEAVGDEDRRYTALSNVLKARHDMAKNAIGNIR